MNFQVFALESCVPKRKQKNKICKTTSSKIADFSVSGKVFNKIASQKRLNNIKLWNSFVPVEVAVPAVSAARHGCTVREEAQFGRHREGPAQIGKTRRWQEIRWRRDTARRRVEIFVDEVGSRAVAAATEIPRSDASSPGTRQSSRRLRGTTVLRNFQILGNYMPRTAFRAAHCILL